MFHCFKIAENLIKNFCRDLSNRIPSFAFHQCSVWWVVQMKRYFVLIKQTIINYQFLVIWWSFKSQLSNGHSPQIRKNGELLVRMCRMRVSFFQKWPLANVGKFGESKQNRLANVGEFIESEQNRLANVGESGEYLPSLLINVGSSKIGCFMHK